MELNKFKVTPNSTITLIRKASKADVNQLKHIHQFYVGFLGWSQQGVEAEVEKNPNWLVIESIHTNQTKTSSTTISFENSTM
jgi:hypothetical protein